MQRIVIIGCSGSGKSTLARALGERLGLPVTHLDALFWQPGWKEHPDKPAFQAQIRAIAAGERWIIDGGYSTGSARERFSRADTVALFDLPTWLCMWRVCWRVIECAGRTRADMAPGCPEKVDLEFLHYVWTYRRRVLPKLEQRIAADFKGTLIRLKNPRDIAAFVATVPGGQDECR